MAPAQPEESEPPEAVAPEAPKLDVSDGTGVSEEPPFRMDRAKIQRMFQIMDSGDSGALDHDAIARHAFPSSEMQRKKLRHVYAKQLIEVADTSADGTVDFDEFERFVRHKEIELWILFSQLDRHGDGELDLEDLTHALKLAGTAGLFKWCIDRL
jgi:Ca2+-binding EF-hand superfamily protein